MDIIDKPVYKHGHHGSIDILRGGETIIRRRRSMCKTGKLLQLYEAFVIAIFNLVICEKMIGLGASKLIVGKGSINVHYLSWQI